MPVADGTFYTVFTATAGQVAFAFAFPIIEAAHLAIYINGVAKAFGVDYTVSSAGFEDGGTATLVVALVGGETVMLRRQTPVSQALDLSAAEGFYEQAITDAFDRITMIVQELSGQAIPLYPPGYMLRINGSGTGIEAVATATGVAVAMDYGAAAPTSGTWAAGFFRWNSAPVAGGALGWVCIAGGTPGTWQEAGVINL